LIILLLLQVWDIIGRAVVLHEREDDFSNRPHGNAGKGYASSLFSSKFNDSILFRSSMHCALYFTILIADRNT